MDKVDPRVLAENEFVNHVERWALPSVMVGIALSLLFAGVVILLEVFHPLVNVVGVAIMFAPLGEMLRQGHRRYRERCEQASA